MRHNVFRSADLLWLPVPVDSEVARDLGLVLRAIRIDARADEVARVIGGHGMLFSTSLATWEGDEQVSFAERPEVLKLSAMRDPAEIVTAYAHLLSDADQRVSAIYEVVRSAAGIDPEVRELWTEIGRQRLAGAKRIATLLRSKGGLRKGLSVESARDIIWIYNDPAVHHALVGVRRWRQNQFRDWLADTLKHQLLG